jgi:hypothetical protein
VDPWQESANLFFNREAELHKHLVANGLAMSSQQKMIAFDVIFKSNFSVMRFKMLFEDANPTDTTRTWANLKASMGVQAKNITRAEGLTRADVYAKANAPAADHMP